MQVQMRMMESNDVNYAHRILRQAYRVINSLKSGKQPRIYNRPYENFEEFLDTIIMEARDRIDWEIDNEQQNM